MVLLCEYQRKIVNFGHDMNVIFRMNRRVETVRKWFLENVFPVIVNGRCKSILVAK